MFNESGWCFYLPGERTNSIGRVSSTNPPKSSTVTYTKGICCKFMRSIHKHEKIHLVLCIIERNNVPQSRKQL